MLVIPNVLHPDELARVRALLEDGPWVDGAATAGARARRVKNNDQLGAGPESAEAGRIVRAALERSALFTAAALPARVLAPTFSRYAPGQGYGDHVDNALRQDGVGRLRADLSVTLFLSAPEDYEGGELVIGGAAQAWKLPAGAALLYPATSVHRVEPVTRGMRLAAVTWVQSLVRDGEARALLFEMDGAIRALGDHPSAVRLTGVWHNLLRRWMA